jgi:hypothetical protein
MDAHLLCQELFRTWDDQKFTNGKGPRMPRRQNKHSQRATVQGQNRAGLCQALCGSTVGGQCPVEVGYRIKTSGPQMCMQFP